MTTASATTQPDPEHVAEVRVRRIPLLKVDLVSHNNPHDEKTCGLCLKVEADVARMAALEILLRKGKSA